VSFPGHDDHPVGDGITPAPNLWTYRGELQLEAIPSWPEPPGTAAVWTSVNEPSRLMTYAFTDEPRPTWTARRDASFRFTVMAIRLLPTLAFSDPHRDPHRAGRGRIPLDGSASIRLPSEFAMDVHGRPWTAISRTGNAVSGVTRIEGSNPSRSAKSLVQQQLRYRCSRSMRRLTR
jgi:hypothetical protein